MSSPDLPENLLRLIAAAIPSFPAAELLLFLAREPRPWSAEEVVPAIHPAIITAAAAAEAFALFKVANLVVEEPAGSFRYAPATPALAAAVDALAQAYNERPVTLIRTISRLSDHKIQMFADSFKLKRR